MTGARPTATSTRSTSNVRRVSPGEIRQLVGAHIVGPDASELIGELTLGLLIETTLEELDLAVHPHPTLSDAIPEAALMALGRVIHL